MHYRNVTVEGRLLENDPEAVGQVIRWIASVLTWPRFWALRNERKDLHQEVLTRVVESLHRGRFDDSRNFRTYVQGIARFTALQALTRHREGGTAPIIGESPDPESPNPEELALHRRLARRVIDMASEECRELIRDYFFEQQNYAEIAESLGVPVGTVKSRLFRCLESAHRSLLGRGVKRPGR